MRYKDRSNFKANQHIGLFVSKKFAVELKIYEHLVERMESNFVKVLLYNDQFF